MSNSSCLVIDCQKKQAVLGDLCLPCRIGKAGYIAQNHGTEGDEKTPLGEYHLRWGFYRADRLPKPPLHSENPLTWRTLQPQDGWCDASEDEAYNRFMRLPSDKSHEKLWRKDGAYDIILVISHNDAPPIKKLGSAVFIHIAQADDRETLGCIALAPEDMIKLLPHLERDMTVRLYE